MSKKYNLYRAPGEHLSFAKRQIIETAYNGNLRQPKCRQLSLRGLAAELCLPYTTLRREVARGLVPTPNTFRDRDVWDYSAERAQADADAKAANKGCPMKMTARVAEMLKREIAGNRLSPNHARAKLAAEGVRGVPSLSSVYHHIWNGDIGVPPERMPYPRRRRTRKVAPSRRALKTPGRRSIEERPGEVAGRDEFGHWEMDTVVSCVSGRGGLLVLVERMTRLYLIRKIDSVCSLGERLRREHQPHRQKMVPEGNGLLEDQP